MAADLLTISSRDMSVDFNLRRAFAELSYPPSMWNQVRLAPPEPTEMAELFCRAVTLRGLIRRGLPFGTAALAWVIARWNFSLPTMAE